AGRDAAQDAAGMIREELHLAALHAHLVGILLARQRRGGEAGADLDAFDGVDAHHRLGELGIELVRGRITEAGPHAARHHLDDGAGRRALLARVVEEAFPALHHLPVGAPEGIIVDRVPLPARAVDGMRPDLDQGAADGDAGTQDLARYGAGGNARRGLARRGAAAAAVVADAVFLPVGIVGMARPEAVLDRRVVLAARILVLDHERDRRARGLTFEHTGEDLDLVGLAALRREARLPRLATVEPMLDVRGLEREAGRRALDDAADRRPVALAP